MKNRKLPKNYQKQGVYPMCKDTLLSHSCFKIVVCREPLTDDSLVFGNNLFNGDVLNIFL